MHPLFLPSTALDSGTLLLVMTR